MAGTVTSITAKKKVQPGAEYVSGSPYGIQQPRALPNVEDLDIKNGKLSHEVIDMMLTDPDVYAGLLLLALMALNEKLLITPAITEVVTVDTVPADNNPASTNKNTDPAPTQQKDDQPTDNSKPTGNTEPMPDAATDPARIARAKEIADFCQRQYDRVPKIASIIFEMVFEGMAHGNKVAEIVYDVAARGLDAERWVLDKLKTKPRETVAFVIDAYGNEIGLLGAAPGQASVVQTTVANADEIIEREKFAVFTYRPKNGDPRGNTALAAALNGWELKRRTFPEYLLFLMVSAIPGILATLPAGADEMAVYEDDGITPKRDSNGEPITVSAHQFLLNMLSQMRNHQVGVAPDGTEFTVLEVANEGEAFIKGLNKFGSEITMAILCQQLATRDSQHQTKGATGEQARVIDYIVWWIRDTAADMVRYDIFKTLVRYNFGDEDAEELLPKCTYGNTEARDFATDASAISSLASALTDSQLQHLLNQIGVPAPTEAEQAFKRMAKQLMQQGQQAALQNQNSDDPADTSTGKDKNKDGADKSSDKAGGTGK